MNKHDTERHCGPALAADHPAQLSRRRWLQAIGAAAVGLLAEGCLPQSSASAPQPIAAARPTAPALQPLASPLVRVAIAQAASYDQSLVRHQMRALIDGIGGLDDLI